MKLRKTIYSLIIILSVNFTIYSDISLSQFVQVSNGMGLDKTVRALLKSGNTIYAGTYNVPSPEGIFYTTNGGMNWWSTTLANRSIHDLIIFGNRILAATHYSPPSGVYVSTSNGWQWYPSPVNVSYTPREFTVMGNRIFVALDGGGVAMSVDSGETWTPTNFGNKWVNNVAVIGDTLYAGTGQAAEGLYFSTNYGNSWALTGLTGYLIYALATSGREIYAGGASQCWYSSDAGASWVTTNLNKRTRKLFCYYDYVFAGVDYLSGGGVYMSTNKGTSWTLISYGMPQTTPNEIIIADGYMYLGTGGQSVWRRPLSEIVSVTTESSNIPQEHSLKQNYPNPFNPETTIDFNIHNTGNVKLTIYDLTGKEISTLINKSLSSGTYSVTWDGTMHESGVYFYTLEINGYKETKKMLLIK